MTAQTITVETGRSDEGGFGYAQMTSNDLTARELWNLGSELESVGALKRISGYEIVDPRVTERLGYTFAVAALRELIATARTVQSARRLDTVKCACGHTVARGQAMSTASGTSCPACYDRMDGAE